jgi:pyruvate kinase
VVISLQGRSLAVMSSSRPSAPIIGISPGQRASRVANLLWGVVPQAADTDAIEDPYTLARKIVRHGGLAAPGDTILLVRGFSHDPGQNTPSVTIVTV